MLPDRLFDAARTLLAREATGTAFRLIGIGANPLLPGERRRSRRSRRHRHATPGAAQAAIDTLRDRFGDDGDRAGARVW